MLDTEGGVTQEPPSTRPALEIAEELDAETDAARQEPTSTSERGTTQTGVLTQSKDVADRGKELEVTAGDEIDQVGKLFQFPSYFSIPKGARVSRSSRHAGEDVVVPPILKFDGSNKGPAATSLLAVNFQRDLSQEPKREEETSVSETREHGGEILVETPMDTHQVSPPSIEIASQRVEAGVNK